jgi:DNA-binding transcriptional MerR regulator
MSEPDPAAGVYTISVAAELTGVTVRSLRLYERHGLLEPARTSGGTRRYSQDDLRRLHRITELVADGVNLTGIGRILDLERDTHDLRTDNARLHAEREQPARRERTGQGNEPVRRRSVSRHSPTDGHRDQPARPG